MGDKTTISVLVTAGTICGALVQAARWALADFAGVAVPQEIALAITGAMALVLAFLLPDDFLSRILRG